MKSDLYNRPSSNVSNYIDSLINPPALANPPKRSSSQKKINGSSISIGIIDPAPADPLPSKLSPLKKRAKSEETASQIFATAKHYAEQQGQGSMLLSRISELTEGAAVVPTPKEVKFRQNIIMRNGHNRREGRLAESRTPSILKKSQLLRNNCAIFLQRNTHKSAQRGLANEDRQERAAKSNEIINRRYVTILERFQSKFSAKLRKGMSLRSDEKYQDDLFPPIPSSVFTNSKSQLDAPSGQRWIRVSELYKHLPLVVFNENTPSTVFPKCADSSNNFMGEAFNCIRNCKTLLRKMFERSKISEYGVYIVKIFQENVWKSVMVDDYIPVWDKEGQLTPVFLNCLRTDDVNPFEIWPFLLEKAYANYYANYHSLHFGNTLDYLQEITGLPAETFQYHSILKSRVSSMKRLHSVAAQKDAIFLGFIQGENAYVPLQIGGNETFTAYLTKEEVTTTVEIDHVFEYFDKVYAICVSQWRHSCVSTIGINIRKSQNPFRFDISIRTLKVSKSGLVSLTIRQKQRRLYQHSSLNYNYIWIRVIILLKEFDGDCRWIDGGYSNSKSITFLRMLQAGEYYIILMPQWRPSHCYQLSLLAHAETVIEVGRRQYDENEQLVEKGCCDLAQRKGKLYQINMYACSYTLISEDLAMLIENINNQRYQGSIRINRSIARLRPTVELVPFNREFYQQTIKAGFNNSLSVYIPADNSFTVIMMMRGGVDLNFLRKFDFGR